MLVLERAWALSFLLAPLLWVLARRLLAGRIFLPLGLADSRGVPPPLPSPTYRVASALRRLLAALGYLLLVFAAAGPALVSQRLLYLERGNEVMLVVDVSPSMAASDILPDRLGAARAIIRIFLASRRNEAVGLVAFGGEAALISPPTLDYAALLGRLDSLAPGMLGECTAIGSGIAVAASHGLPAGRGRERHIVLLTDGENNAGSLAPASAAALAADAGFVLSVVGIGSRGDAPLDYQDPETGTRRSGTYVSAYDRAELEALARRGGGTYYEAADGKALAAAFAGIAERSLSLSRSRAVASERSLVPSLLLLSLAALALARLLGLATGSELA